MGKKDSKGLDKEDCNGKDEGPIIVVLRIEMHCEGCAQNVRRSVKGFKGVEAVASDVFENKLTVIGKVDPMELRCYAENKVHKKVDLISPAPSIKKVKEKPKDEVKGDANALKIEKDKDQKKVEDKKPKEPMVQSVVLKIRLHCEGCIQRIRKHVLKIKGVESVSFDSEKDLVTVKGTMDVKNMPELLTAKLRRAVETVNPKKEAVGNNNEKGQKNKKNVDGGKKEKGAEEAKNAPAASVMSTAATSGATAVDAMKMDFSGGGYGNYPYRIEMAHAPQLFSDENPNACSIM